MFAVCTDWVETFQGKGGFTSNAAVDPQVLQQRLLDNHTPQSRFLLKSILGEASPWPPGLYRKYGSKFNLSTSVNIFWLSTLCQIIGIFSKWFFTWSAKGTKALMKRKHVLSVLWKALYLTVRFITLSGWIKHGVRSYKGSLALDNGGCIL